MVREADDYLADLGQPLASAEDSKGPAKRRVARVRSMGDAATGEYLTCDLSAVDLKVYPFVAVFLRQAGRRADFVKDDVIEPRLAVWMARMQRLPLVERTWPPH